MAPIISIPAELIEAVPPEKITEFQNIIGWFQSLSSHGNRVAPRVQTQLRNLGWIDTPPAILTEYNRLMSESMLVHLVKRPLHDVDTTHNPHDILWRRLANVETMLETALVVIDSWPPVPVVRRSGIRQLLAHTLSTVVAQYDELRGGNRSAHAQSLRRESPQWVNFYICLLIVHSFRF